MNSNDEIEILFKDPKDSYAVSKLLRTCGWNISGSCYGPNGRTIYVKPPANFNLEEVIPKLIPVNLPEL